MKRIVLQQDDWVVSDQEGPCWIRAGGSTPEALEALAGEVGLHPLAIEDVGNARQRPKVEDYEDHTFVVVRVPRSTDPDKGWQQVGIWLFEDKVVTASPSPVPELDKVEERLLRKPQWAHDVPMVWYRILDALVDAWFPTMDALEEEVEATEDRAVDEPTQEVLAEIRHLKRNVSRIRKLLIPLREAAISLERVDHPNVPESLRLYLRDISDHTIRLAERLEHVRDIALISQESWNSSLANQQNQVMKRLTVIAALLLVPGLFAGLGGMNFEGIPDWDYWTVTGTILAFIVIGIAVSIWRKWL